MKIAVFIPQGFLPSTSGRVMTGRDMTQLGMSINEFMMLCVPMDELNHWVVNHFWFPRNPIWFEKNKNIKTFKVVRTLIGKQMFYMRNAIKASVPLGSSIAKVT